MTSDSGLGDFPAHNGINDFRATCSIVEVIEVNF